MFVFQGCSIPKPSFLIEAFIPETLFKVFTLMKCPNKWSFGGEFNDDGIFTMDCPSGGKVFAYKHVTEGLEDADFIKYIQNFQNPNMTVEYEYKGPTKIDLPGGYAVRAECEGKEKLFMNVQKNKAVADTKPVVQKAEQENVLVIMMDAISRGQFMRSFTKTVEYLEGMFKGEGNYTHEAFQFLRYHSVWSNTRPNLCQLTQVTKNNTKMSVWGTAKERGYVAMLSNDQCELFASIPTRTSSRINTFILH